MQLGDGSTNNTYRILMGKPIGKWILRSPRRKWETIGPYGDNIYPKVSGLSAWSENYKWYSSLPL
jgi:hypothetical protein